jgi:hypothetical protein
MQKWLQEGAPCCVCTYIGCIVVYLFVGLPFRGSSQCMVLASRVGCNKASQLNWKQWTAPRAALVILCVAVSSRSSAEVHELLTLQVVTSLPPPQQIPLQYEAFRSTCITSYSSFTPVPFFPWDHTIPVSSLSHLNPISFRVMVMTPKSLCRPTHLTWTLISPGLWFSVEPLGAPTFRGYKRLQLQISLRQCV